jgi:hypothetical protein
MARLRGKLLYGQQIELSTKPFPFVHPPDLRCIPIALANDTRQRAIASAVTSSTKRAIERCSLDFAMFWHSSS